ncbi:MAG: hypothetical protein JWO68_2375 [Actinomycetia bacterium]|nr:hypothetical protein [Actinomycetes bacterium]
MHPGAGAAGVAGAGAAIAVGIAGLVPPLAVAGLAAVALAAPIAAAFARRRPPPPVDDDPAATLDRIEAQIAGKVPDAVVARVHHIATTLRETIPRLDQLGPGSTMAHAAVQTATSYLPEALGAYLRLPRSYADRRPVSGGKTSFNVLCDQLDLLAAKMDEVFVAVCRADSDALIAHGRFLTEKFGSGAANSLHIGPSR